MKNDICRRLLGLLTIPSKDSSEYNSWFEQTDFIDFLEENTNEEKIVVYASSSCYPSAGPASSLLIYSILIPKSAISPPDIEDLLTWNFLIRNTAWSVREDGQEAWLEPSLSNLGSKSLAQGEHLVFNRSLEGVEELSYYIEIQQNFSQVCGIHHMPERKAWCRLDQRGDIEEVVQVINVPQEDEEEKNKYSGKIVLFNRGALEKYATLTETVLVRLFDFDRAVMFGPFGQEKPSEDRSKGENIFYRYGGASGNLNYVRGIQLVPIVISKKKVVEDIQKLLYGEEIQQEKFTVSCDFENKKTAEISYEPDVVAIAFFRPEVLSKYKADHEKYNFEEDQISSRSFWCLEFYGINEAGQVYAFLKHLSNLPNDEQKYWKLFNERPKTQISHNVFRRFFLGEPYSHYSPLASLKDKLRNLRCKWWKVPTPDAMRRAQYPVTNLNDEWRNEILNLDQLLVEGFKENWLRKKAEELGRAPGLKNRSLKLLEEYLIGLDFEEDHARSIIAPLQELHYLKTKLRGHASGETAQKLKMEAFAEHGGYNNHYKNLATQCDKTMQVLIEAFQDSRMN